MKNFERTECVGYDAIDCERMDCSECELYLIDDEEEPIILSDNDIKDIFSELFGKGDE